jgi:hypothetical protein
LFSVSFCFGSSAELGLGKKNDVALALLRRGAFLCEIAKSNGYLQITGHIERYIFAFSHLEKKTERNS